MQGKNFVNGITGTLRNVKDLAGHAIDDLEKALPGDRKRKCRVHIDVSCCQKPPFMTVPDARHARS